MTPSDLQAAYGVPAGGGAGRTVAVYGGGGDLADAESDLGVYRSYYGLPPCTSANGCFMKVDEHGGTSYPSADTSAGDELEQMLDLEMVSAGCPACKIMFIEGPDLDVTLATVKASGAAALSFSFQYSYGSDGTNASVCQSSGFDDIGSGLLITGAMGDGGYPSLADWVPVSCQGVVAVGGTSLAPDSSPRGWSETVWSGTGSACTDAVAKPSWQTDTGCSMRMAGDVSAVADVYTPVSVYSYEGAGGWTEVGGTSASSPLVAGVLTAVGLANGQFSPAWIWQHTDDFHDVTSGSNGTCGGEASYVCNAGPGYDGPTGWGTPNGQLLTTATGGGPPYAATFVGQSFPLATSSALTMVAGQVIPSYIELRNTGAKTWDSNTRIATAQPRDRTSVIADATWIAPNRLAAVQGTVPPGGTYKFTFDLTAPTTAGSYDEFFGVTEEGVAWFSDPGQGGPADNFLEVKVDVVAAEYQGTFKDQSFPVSPSPLTVHEGNVTSGYFELVNSGTQTWKAGVTMLAPIPRDTASPFAEASWVSPTRISTLSADVAPGAVGRFEATFDAAKVGDTAIALGLVENDVTWFADAPLGGGPPDGSLVVHLVVVPVGTSIDSGAGDPSVGSGGGTLDAGGAGSAADSAGSSGGCSVGAAGTTGPGGDFALGGMLIIIMRVASRFSSVRARVRRARAGAAEHRREGDARAEVLENR